MSGVHRTVEADLFSSNVVGEWAKKASRPDSKVSTRQALQMMYAAGDSLTDHEWDCLQRWVADRREERARCRP